MPTALRLGTGAAAAVPAARLALSGQCLEIPQAGGTAGGVLAQTGRRGQEPLGAAHLLMARSNSPHWRNRLPMLKWACGTGAGQYQVR